MKKFSSQFISNSQNLTDNVYNKSVVNNFNKSPVNKSNVNNNQQKQNVQFKLKEIPVKN